LTKHHQPSSDSFLELLDKLQIFSTSKTSLRSAEFSLIFPFSSFFFFYNRIQILSAVWKKCDNKETSLIGTQMHDTGKSSGVQEILKKIKPLGAYRSD
jgi:hypothetical protein